MVALTTGKWYTFAAYGYSAGSQTLYLDIRGTGSAAIFRLGGFQIWRFDTEAEAVNFLKSGSFCSPVVFKSETYDPPSLANGLAPQTQSAFASITRQWRRWILQAERSTQPASSLKV